jgi:hypothetical protein
MKSQNMLVTKSIATLGDDNIWEVTGDMIASHKEGDDGSWLTRTISVKSFDKDVERAVSVVQEALNKKFQALSYDLFNLTEEDDGHYIPYPADYNQATR